MKLDAVVAIIRLLDPDVQDSMIAERVQKFNEISSGSKKESSMGKNQDYQKGYEIGAYVANAGEDLDVKGIDQLGNELLEELDYGKLRVANADDFKDGLLNGYAFSDEIEEQEEKKKK